MTNSSIVSSQNPKWGTVQPTTFTDIVESLPAYYAVLSALGQTVDVHPGRSESQTIRSTRPISITNDMMIPLNPSIYEGNRTIDIEGDIVIITPAEYGISFILSERTRVNTPEDIGAALSPLIADYAMQLKETIMYNLMISSNRLLIEFTQGGVGSERKANIDDFIDAACALEESGVTPVVDFLRATDQVGSSPIPKSFVLVTSNAGHCSIKKNLKADEFSCIQRYAGIVDYALASKGSITRANTEVCVSGAVDKGTVAERIGLLVGNQSIYKTGNTPINSRTLIRPASESPFAYWSSVEHLVSFGAALSSHNRIAKTIFAD